MKQGEVPFKSEFKVILGNPRSQAAEMVLAPGKNEGGPDNRHKGADQWMFVLAGRGAVVINGKKQKIGKSSLVLIERGDTHEIRNTGTTPLKTLNFYVPPAYTAAGDELPAGKPK
jgi:mannose-6-phosphate isomerase-like protein (cupin superfamily)